MKRLSALTAWLALSLITTALLVARELDLRAGTEPVAPAPVAVAAPAERQHLAAQALVLAFGFKPAEQEQASRPGLKLLASFIPSQGEPRALVAAAESEATYRVGDRLPDGSVLRQVQGQSITVWFNGREQRVHLAASQASVFRPAGSASPAHTTPATSARVLREVH
ncbi:hypothetical protein [Pseudomonas faucium]|uniref:hypothetical protein n=1 Tax=Pseudomonas faucium TaxID=2740518 RepID=UPI0039C21042